MKSTGRPVYHLVDAIFQPAPTIRELAHSIASELDLPADWLIDGAKGFVSARCEMTTGEIPHT
jgi:hypothetical protein